MGFEIPIWVPIGGTAGWIVFVAINVDGLSFDYGSLGAMVSIIASTAMLGLIWCLFFLSLVI